MDRYVEELKKSLSSTMSYEKTYIHPEESGNEKLNKAFTKGFEDITVIDTSLKKLADKTEQLFKRTTDRLDVVRNTILSEKERLQDISMLCNMKTDYENVIPLKDNDFTGEFAYENGVFYSALTASSVVGATVHDVQGNGYQGNKYILKNDGYLENTLNTSIQSAIVDGNISTYWEYSRITASSSEDYTISDFHMDDAEAKCTITLKFVSAVNELIVKSSSNNIKVTGIKYSNDEINFKDVAMMPFTINNKDDSYKNQGYIYGSNIISFPSCKYVKITFESIGYTNETVGFERTEVNSNNTISTITTIVPSAKRHVVRINDIISREKRYAGSSIMTTGELITSATDVYAISVFANVYYPDGMSTDNVKFTLTINGEDIEVKPVNSYENGIKIVRFSQGKMPAEYTKYIGEKIKSAKLTVSMKSKSNLTPYINNIKILLGGSV